MCGSEQREALPQQDPSSATTLGSARARLCLCLHRKRSSPRTWRSSLERGRENTHVCRGCFGFRQRDPRQSGAVRGDLPSAAAQIGLMSQGGQEGGPSASWLQ